MNRKIWTTARPPGCDQSFPSAPNLFCLHAWREFASESRGTHSLEFVAQTSDEIAPGPPHAGALSLPRALRGRRLLHTGGDGRLTGHAA